METYKISVNQLASFSNKSERGKVSIVRQQKRPSNAVVAKYRRAKNIIANTIINNGNRQILDDGIQEIKMSVADTKWKMENKSGSIAALEKFANASIPHILHDNVFESFKPTPKNRLVVSDVEIIVSPDIIIKTIIDGQAFYGAIKIHISKSNIFDREEAKYITTCLYQYMNKHYGNLGGILPELCICVDVWGGNIKYAPSETENAINRIIEMCEEIKKIWRDIAA